MPLTKIFRSNLVLGFIFIIILSLTAHYLYSWIGLNPTDDGFILAQSRRLIDGQVIHRDFISIRPVGSYFLHIPEVLFGGDYTIWLSRYITLFELTSIAWFSVILIERFLSPRLTPVEKLLFALIAFIFGTHTFPLLSWNSIDALYLSLFGIVLSMNKNKFAKGVGYILIGFSPLCRQNFLLLIPVTLFLFGDYKKIRYVVLSILPLFAYLLYLILLSALPDALMQLTTQSDAIPIVVVRRIGAREIASQRQEVEGISTS